MPITREMTITEINVLNAIKNSATYDLPIQARELRQQLGLSKRSLEAVIENLRVIYKQPIVAKKKNSLADTIFQEMKKKETTA
ncbi:hypothetical protein [Streptococcus agalactiae]|uniref:hypothetical protein n=1 Tax=Streptococcus agalactiae TaxID=1311 RepID=UPI001F276400|nr:hypothetical protein [Streptococcus agalactiae]